MKWTEEQKKAITEHGKNIIVSAAAGSGKTAVLTERVIQYLINGGDIEKLLVVTFTNAAAAEMRNRIASSLAEACVAEPQNKHLRSQRIKLPRASICTIDSYTARLIRQNFEQLAISPRFSTMDETELDYMAEIKLSEILEKRYLSGTLSFSELLQTLGGEDENISITEAVISVYKYMQSIPFCDKWLSTRLNHYDNAEIWINAACDYFNPFFAEAQNVFEKLADSDGLSPKEKESALKDSVIAKNMYTACKNMDYKDLYKQCSSVVFEKKPNVNKNSPESILYKNYRDEFKKLIGETNILKISFEDLSIELSALKQAITELSEIVRELEYALNKEFRKKNRYPFSEISKMALSLLVKEPEGESCKAADLTPLAYEIRKKYDEVLIDEYQDVNDLQDLFFYAVSDNNLFVVGDVKQSVYGFRHANPQNFIRKKNNFYKIDLNKNFRSRKGILSFTNFICEMLFSERFGELLYDEKEALCPGLDRYEGFPSPDVEINIMTGDKLSVSDQAQLVANRIKTLIKENYKIIQKDGTSKNIQPSDIAILLSVVRGNEGETFRRVLTENGIPVYMESGSTFLQSYEVNTVINLLKAIRNPYSDTSLFITMASPIYGFTDEKFAKIRLAAKKNKRLFSAVTEYAKTDPETKVFTDDLEKLRILAANLPLSSLIWHIYTDKEYLSYVSTLESGDIRYENMMTFLNFVRKYETDISSGTLSGFLSFIDFSIKNEKLPQQESPPHGSYVTITSIHKSKGLEFPVCVLPRLEKKSKKEYPDFMIDEKLGIATKIRNREMTYKKRTFMYEMASMNKETNNLSETLRRLYVAMTRAKQKMILIGAIPQKALNKFPEKSLCGDGKSTFLLYMRTYDNFLDLILSAIFTHPDCVTQLNSLAKPRKPDFNIYINISDTPENSSTKEFFERPEYTSLLSEQEMRRRFEFKYSPSLSHIPAKISVTELTKGFSADKDSLSLIPRSESSIPDFLSDKQKITGAEAGTAMHKFMAFADLSKDIPTELDSMVNRGLLTQPEADSVRIKDVENYTKSDLFKKIMSASACMKEYEFLVRINASEYDKTVQTDKKILLQGAIDLLCEYNDGFIIVDYKTDNKSEDELVEHYSKQMYYYKYAVEKIFEKKVKQIYIWSMRKSKAIEVRL